MKVADLSDSVLLKQIFLTYEVGSTGITRKKRRLSILEQYDSNKLSGVEEYKQEKRESTIECKTS